VRLVSAASVLPREQHRRAATGDLRLGGGVDADDGHGVPRAAYQLVHSSAESARLVAAALSVGVDAVLIEHEFGIFGGRRSVLHAFTDDLEVPYVLTLHTVAARFPEWQRAALAASLAAAALVFVFSEQAVGLLVDQLPGLAQRCRVVPHGSPAEMYRSRTPALRRHLRLPAEAKVISTFGLLSPSKGIEHAIHAIRAMPLLRRAAG
jgi:glycosyltransferase involved in cell wall biosynthesis